ncbi:MAG: response regulator [Rhodocyclaceae bacterium]
MGHRLNVFLIEDSPLLRAQLIETLEDLEGIHVVGHAEDEATAIARLAANPADLTIVDLELKSGSGIGVLRALKDEPSRFHYTWAVVLTTHSHPAVRQRCTQLGARAFFDKAMQMDELIDYVAAAQRTAG